MRSALPPDLVYCRHSGNLDNFELMKIVVLDGYAMNPGDLSWDALKALGELTLYDRSTLQETLARTRDAAIILTNKAVVSAEVIERATHLKYIGVMATGFNVVDLKAAAARGIVVSNVPTYSTVSVAQHTFALILALANQTARYGESVAAGDWVKSKDFSYLIAPLLELEGKTLGIVGLGRIGQAVAKIGLAFGMKVIAVHKHPERDRMEGVSFTDIRTLFEQADFISLHCPLNEANQYFVNRQLLESMKSTAFLINTSRGPLIQEQDLADALNKGRIAGAALDVLTAEPPTADNPLFGARNCLITPHIGWATREARTRLMTVITDNLRSFLEGTPVNVVV